MISLTFIWHDCFILRTSRFAVVFDYWLDGPDASAEATPAFLKDIPAEMPLYVLISHHHKDHLNRSVFGWEEFHPQIRYIISKDTAKACGYLLREGGIYRGRKPTAEKVSVLKVGESYSDGLLSVEAFGSTDIGNSYLLTFGAGEKERRVFHAGDLNAWLWKDESTEQEINKALGDYRVILNKIAARAPRIDMAMFPVDSRIGTDYWEGAKMFVRSVEVGHFFPMHFCLADDAASLRGRFADACRFDRYANPERGEYIALQSPYSRFACAD